MLFAAFQKLPLTVSHHGARAPSPLLPPRPPRPPRRLTYGGRFPTVHTDPHPNGRKGAVHPEQHRVVSVRECARSQVRVCCGIIKGYPASATPAWTLAASTWRAPPASRCTGMCTAHIVYGTHFDNSGALPACRSRAQGFPDHFRFAGDMPHRYRQVGNAVPPPLARALGEELARASRAGAARAGAGAVKAEEVEMAAGAVEVDR